MRKINIQKRCRRLETISKGDILIFPDREEKVRENDLKTGDLYTEKTRTLKKGWMITEQVSYHILGDKLFPTSCGEVYDYIKHRLS